MSELKFEILPQPDDETCGATCLHALYKFYGEDLELLDIAEQIGRLDTGGTLAVILGIHALERGYKATIYTYNMLVFDPSWFEINPIINLIGKLKSQLEHKTDPKVQWASRAYLRFLELGGKIKFEKLSRALLRSNLEKGTPLLTGLNATYLYHWPREINNEFDDVRGTSMGHFVVLNGYIPYSKNIVVADPLLSNPFSNQHYEVHIDTVITSILLGVLTYDANFMVIEKPKKKDSKKDYGESGGGKHA